MIVEIRYPADLHLPLTLFLSSCHFPFCFPLPTTQDALLPQVRVVSQVLVAALWSVSHSHRVSPAELWHSGTLCLLEEQVFIFEPLMLHLPFMSLT